MLRTSLLHQNLQAGARLPKRFNLPLISVWLCSKMFGRGPAAYLIPNWWGGSNDIAFHSASGWAGIGKYLPAPYRNGTTHRKSGIAALPLMEEQILQDWGLAMLLRCVTGVDSVKKRTGRNQIAATMASQGRASLNVTGLGEPWAVILIKVRVAW